jgi:hypothetical protein
MTCQKEIWATINETITDTLMRPKQVIYWPNFMARGKRRYFEQEPILESDYEEAISSESHSGHEDAATVGCDNNASGSQVHIQSRLQHLWDSGCPLLHWRLNELRIQ